MNTTPSSISACIENKIADFMLRSECCVSCDITELNQYLFYGLIDDALNYQFITDILTPDQIFLLAGFTECVVDNDTILDNAGVIVGTTISTTSPVAVGIISEPELEEDLEAASQCIRAQLSDYIAECDCGCNPDGDFYKFVFWGMVDDILRYEFIHDILTIDQINLLIGFVGCSSSPLFFTFPVGGVIPGIVPPPSSDLITDDYPVIGYTANERTYTFDLTDAGFTYPAYFTVKVDHNYEPVGNRKATDQSDLLTLWNSIGLGTVTANGNIFTVIGFHEYDGIFQSSAPMVGPPMSATLDLDSSTPAVVTDFYGLCTDDISIHQQQALNPTWIGLISDLNPLFIEPVNGSEAIWNTYGTANYGVPGTASDGYNIQLAEVNVRGKDINTVLNGVGARTYGYGFFEDGVGYTKLITPKPKMIITISIGRPVLFQNNPDLLATTGFSDPFQFTYNEIDYAVAACVANGIDIRCIQLCYEDNIRGNQDVFLTLNQMTTALQTVANYIHSTYPTIKISCDADNWDILGGHIFTGFSAAVNGLNYMDYIRQYFQFDADLTTYEQNRDRITELSDMFDAFVATFTNGQQMRIAQSAIKIGNPMRFKNGEGLIYAELLLNLIQLNIDRPGILNDFTHFNCVRLAGGQGQVYPAYHDMVLLRDAMQNDGLISYSGMGLDDLVIKAFKKGSNAEVYIVNPTPSVVTISAVTLNSVAVTATVLSYYGDPSGSAQTTYANTGASVILNPYSVTKISTTP